MVLRPWGPKKQARAARILKRASVRLSFADAGFAELLLPLRQGEELTLSGCLEVRVVRGAATVWGTRLVPGRPFQQVVAPPWGSLPRLCAEEVGAEAAAPEGEAVDVLEFLALRSWPVVLCIRLVARPGEAAARDALRHLVLAAEERPRLRVHRAWPALLQHFLELRSGPPTEGDEVPFLPLVLTVVGPKNVGKSTCCRYLLNSLLSSVGEVYFLETDLGQPEMVTPGLVSLYRIRAPLLNFSHAAQPDPGNESLVSFFAGGTTPAIHPMLYARSVRTAADVYFALCQQRWSSSAMPPLVVNTHGWLNGMGLEFVQAVIRTLRPQLIVRIGSPPAAPQQQRQWQQQEQQQQQQHDREGEAKQQEGGGLLLKRKRSLLARHGPLAQGLLGDCPRSQEDRPSVLVDVESLAKGPGAGAADRSKGPPAGPMAGGLRWLRFAAYFRSDLDPCRQPEGSTLRAFFEPLPHTRIPLRRLRFCLLHGPLAPGEIEAAFTGIVVALCSVRSVTDVAAGSVKQPCAGGDQLLRTAELDENSVAQCWATAFVHGVDVHRGDLVVYIRGSADSLRSVDTVVRGDIAWEPHSLRGQQVLPEDGPLGSGRAQPFCSSWVLEGLSVGARAPTTRKNLKRHRTEQSRTAA